MNDWVRWRFETMLTKEPETIEWIKRMPPGSLFWDIGANIGIYSLYAAKTGKRVIAFEPDLQNLEALRHNATGKNITVVEAALWSGVELLTFSDQGTAGKSGGQLGEGSRLLWTETGDRMMQIHGKPDYVKIDIDGFEEEILLGMPEVLSRAAGVLVEINQNLFQIFRIMKRFGFSEDLGIGKLRNRSSDHNYIFRRK